MKNWVTNLLATDAESFKGKLSLLILDKLLIGMIVALAFVAYDRYRTGDQRRFERDMASRAHELEAERSANEAARMDRSASIQREFERARLARDLLPLVLDESSDVVARGYVLSSALTAGLVDPAATVEVAATLREQGLPDSHVRRLVSVAMPGGLGAIARHGNRLRSEWVEGGEHPSHAVHPPDAPTLSASLQSTGMERVLWASAIRESLPRIDESQERAVVTRDFLVGNLDGLYFLLNEGSSTVAGDLFRSPSRTLRLIGALHSLINNWGPTPEAAAYLEAELASLDLSQAEDLAYARTLVDVLGQFGEGPRPQGHGGMAPQVAAHLAGLLVDDSFIHRVPWIANDAPPEERSLWLSEEPAADAHSSIQYAAGELLWRMGGNAREAEETLIAFVDTLARDVSEAKGSKELSYLSSQYGSYSVRFAISTLGNIDSPSSRAAIKKVQALGNDALSAFEGIRMELEGIEQRRSQ